MKERRDSCSKINEFGVMKHVTVRILFFKMYFHDGYLTILCYLDDRMINESGANRSAGENSVTLSSACHMTCAGIKPGPEVC